MNGPPSESMQLGNDMYFGGLKADDIKILVADIYITGEAEILEINPYAA